MDTKVQIDKYYLIVLGIIYARNEEIFKPYIDKFIESEAIPAASRVCEIRPAALGDQIGDYAALSVALR